METGPIGVFDSGYGGLTILRSIREIMPGYDYVYLGDNARAPYGTKDFDTVFEYTLQAVRKLFGMGCPLVILACNTASAKALRNIQQHYIADCCPERRVLGVIRPTAEIVGTITKTGHIGILATPGTIKSESYVLEIRKFFPDCHVTGLACPSWVPLVESGMYDSTEADGEVRRQIDTLLMMDKDIDTVILGCTHYPLLEKKIRQFCPPYVNIIAQGKYVAESLRNYLERHTGMAGRISKGATCRYFTTDSVDMVSKKMSVFLNKNIVVNSIKLEK
ncbi:MAG: glutamate racemase [Bacteroidaceae bacterium]|nr:glutamate racemase [Bacteroidaceae bacterium]